MFIAQEDYNEYLNASEDNKWRWDEETPKSVCDPTTVEQLSLFCEIIHSRDTSYKLKQYGYQTKEHFVEILDSFFDYWRFRHFISSLECDGDRLPFSVSSKTNEAKKRIKTLEKPERREWMFNNVLFARRKST